MSAIIQKYTNLSSLTKVAFGGGISSITAYAVASTNPVTLVGLAVLGQGVAWLPDGVRRCFRRQPQQAVIVPVAPSALPGPARVANVAMLAQSPAPVDHELQQALQGEEAEDRAFVKELQLALEASRQDWEKDEKSHDEELDRAIAMSLEEEKKVEPPKICAISGVIGDGKARPIPEGMALAIGKDGYCNVADFLQSIVVTEKKNRDLFGNPVSDETLALGAEMMGISSKNFLKVWQVANERHPNYSVASEQNDYSYRSDIRSNEFVRLLQQPTRNHDLQKLRNIFIDYYKKHSTDWWTTHGGH